MVIQAVEFETVLNVFKGAAFETVYVYNTLRLGTNRPEAHDGFDIGRPP